MKCLQNKIGIIAFNKSESLLDYCLCYLSSRNSALQFLLQTTIGQTHTHRYGFHAEKNNKTSSCILFYLSSYITGKMEMGTFSFRGFRANFSQNRMVIPEDFDCSTKSIWHIGPQGKRKSHSDPRWNSLMINPRTEGRNQTNWFVPFVVFSWRQCLCCTSFADIVGNVLKI